MSFKSHKRQTWPFLPNFACHNLGKHGKTQIDLVDTGFPVYG